MTARVARARIPQERWGRECAFRRRPDSLQYQALELWLRPCPLRSACLLLECLAFRDRKDADDAPPPHHLAVSSRRLGQFLAVIDIGERHSHRDGHQREFTFRIVECRQHPGLIGLADEPLHADLVLADKDVFPDRWQFLELCELGDSIVGYEVYRRPRSGRGPGVDRENTTHCMLHICVY